MSQSVYNVGDRLKVLRKGPHTSSHLVRWCAAQQNWDKIHYDIEYTKNSAGLNERVINGGLKQHYLVQILQSNFSPTINIKRLKYEFVGPDYINESLEVRGEVVGVHSQDNLLTLYIELRIWNIDQSKANTLGKAMLVMPTTSAGSRCDGVSENFLSPTLEDLPKSVDKAAPVAISNLVGQTYERLESKFALDLSRLRLFCDAVGELPNIHYDHRAAAKAGYNHVIAPHLFPIHGLEAEPNSLPLSTDLSALGREGVNEVGRNFGRTFGISEQGMVNGGNDVEFISFLELGETVKAESKLLEANLKQGRNGGKMLITTSLNTYSTISERVLLRERQSIIYRNFKEA